VGECSNCRWWKPCGVDDHGVHLGDCAIIRYPTPEGVLGPIVATVWIACEHDQADEPPPSGLTTVADFGCNQHEPEAVPVD
jgi:hypothetical protein